MAARELGPADSASNSDSKGMVTACESWDRRRRVCFLYPLIVILAAAAVGVVFYDIQESPDLLSQSWNRSATPHLRPIQRIALGRLDCRDGCDEHRQLSHQLTAAF
nr:protein arginine N-methyltransferase 1.6 [Ipomoea trifida]